MVILAVGASWGIGVSLDNAYHRLCLDLGRPVRDEDLSHLSQTNIRGLVHSWRYEEL